MKQAVRTLAARHGFDLCRFTRPHIDHKHAVALDSWVEQGMQGDMAWMVEESRLERRKNPESMLQDVATVISVAMRYSPPPYSLAEAETAHHRGTISAYAHGADYHDVMKLRLKALARDLDGLLGLHEQRVYVDTAPVLEHTLAEDSGVGWQGKHSLSIHRELGSWFFLGELFTTAEFEADEKASFHCGTCTACSDICPTRAIVAPFVVDARLCISYLTIEHKGFIPKELRALMGNRIYGCDDCQLICPWNGDISDMQHDLLSPQGENCLPELAILLILDDVAFRARFTRSPVKRLGRERFIRNCCIAAGNSGNVALLPLLWKLAKDESALIRGHAAWAIGMLHSGAGTNIDLVLLYAMMDSETDDLVHKEYALTIKKIKGIQHEA